MIPVSGAPVASHDHAIADLFLSEGAFRFSDGPGAYRRFSRRLTEFLGRPVVVVNLADLRHAHASPHDIPPVGQPVFTKAQIEERAEDLRRLAEASLSEADAGILKEFDLAKTAAFATPVVDTLPTEDLPENRRSKLVSRLEGGHRSRAAIILMPDRNWPEKTKWSFLTGLREDDLVNHPAGGGVDYVAFFHEMAHVEQRYEEPLTNTAAVAGADSGGVVSFHADDAARVVAFKGRKWLYELDADKGADDFAAQMASDPRVPRDLARTIEEARKAVPMARAVSRFLMSPEYYGTGLGLFLHQQGRQPLSFQRHCETQDEILLRCWEHMYGIRAASGDLLSRASDSITVHNTTNGYRNGRLYDLSLLDAVSSACDSPKNPEQGKRLLRTLVDVVRSEPITDPVTLQEIALVLDGARYFNPGIFEGMPPVDAVAICSAVDRDSSDGRADPDMPHLALPPNRPGLLQASAG